MSDKLLINWGAASTVLSTQLRKAIAGWEDYRFLRGSGMAEPLGIINCPAKVNVSRQTASQVTWQDIRTMYSRMKFGGSPVWIASQTILPYLMNIADAGSHNLFVTGYAGAAGTPPATLLGYPIIFADRSPALAIGGRSGTRRLFVLPDQEREWAVRRGVAPCVFHKQPDGHQGLLER